MIKPKILVTGATGNTGRALVNVLRNYDWPVRAMVHKLDQRSEELKKIGAEVVVADMYDSEQIYQAAKGTQRAYYLPLYHPYMIQAANAFVIAVKEVKLESIVQMSQWTSSASHPALLTRQQFLVDQMFSMIPGTAHIIFNPGMFADNFLRIIDFPSLLGVFPVLMGDSQCAPISNEDMAKAVAALLISDPANHAGKSYRPTGSELLTGKDMASIIEKVVGHKVLPLNLPIWLFLKVARMQKVNPYQVAMFIHYINDNKQGTFSFEGGVTNVMQELTGSPAESFETTARRYAAMPFAKQTFANRIKAFANFNIAPFYPSYNLKSYGRALELPTPENSLQCMEDGRWRISHSAQMLLHRNSKLEDTSNLRNIFLKSLESA